MSRSRTRKVRLASALLALGIASAGIVYPIWWAQRSSAVGDVLINRGLSAGASERSLSSNVTLTARSGVSRSKPTACASSSDAVAVSSQTPGVLEVPALGIVAPVLDGLTDAELNVAVGHDPATPWPGDSGEAILEAHDVSYFSNLSLIRTGMTVLWLTRCAQARFQVIHISIRSPGSVVYAPTGSGLALVTCYPTNALYWTSQRFVVETRLLGITRSDQQLPNAEKQPVLLAVHAPAALVGEGLTLATNSLPLGRLYLDGSFPKSWTRSGAPLEVEALALEVLFGAEKALEQENSVWWSALTIPGMRAPSSWPQFSTTDVTIQSVDHKLQSITFSSSTAVAVVVVKGGSLYLGRLS